MPLQSTKSTNRLEVFLTSGGALDVGGVATTTLLTVLAFFKRIKEKGDPDNRPRLSRCSLNVSEGGGEVVAVVALVVVFVEVVSSLADPTDEAEEMEVDVEVDVDVDEDDEDLFFFFFSLLIFFEVCSCSFFVCI